MIVAAGYTLTQPHDLNMCQFVHSAWMASPANDYQSLNFLDIINQAFYGRMNARWERHSYRNARLTVAPSEKIRKELRHIGLQEDDIATIYNGVDTGEFSPAGGGIDRSKLGLPLNAKLGLFVGDIRTGRKNLDTVLTALVSLPDVEIAVVGDVKKSPFPRLALELGIDDRVHFLGYRRDIAELMRASDFFVFPSRYEAGTLVLLEAAASGLPIVTAHTAGGCEVLGSEAAEIVLNPNDATAVSAAISRVTASPERQKAAGRAARQVAERYSWKSMSDQYLGLIEGLGKLRHSALDRKAND